MWEFVDLIVDISTMYIPNPFERRCPYKPGRQYHGWWRQALLLLAVAGIIGLAVWSILAA